MDGDYIKQRIRKAGITLDDAAGLLGVSRQTLYVNLSKSELTSKFKKLVETRLLPRITPGNPTNDTYELAFKSEKDKLIIALQNQIEVQDKLIKVLEERIEDLLHEGKAGARRHSA